MLVDNENQAVLTPEQFYAKVHYMAENELTELTNNEYLEIVGDSASPIDPPADDVPPIDPPADDVPPIDPPADDVPPVEPPADEVPPVEPPADESANLNN